MKHITYGNGALVQVTSPFLDGNAVTLAGTSAALGPVISFQEPHTTTSNLDSIIEHGSAVALAYGGMRIWQTTDGYGGNVSIANGVHLSYGQLGFGSVNGGTYTLNGVSQITNHSLLSVSGGRYETDPLVLNGTLTVSTGSTADVTLAPLQGNGTINVGAGGMVDLERVVAGLHMNVRAGGTLRIGPSPFVGGSGSPMRFLATINEAPGSVVNDENAALAVREIFHRSTGELDLVGTGIGSTVDKLHFAPGADLYTTPNGNGGMLISTEHSAASLPTTFVHT